MSAYDEDRIDFLMMGAAADMPYRVAQTVRLMEAMQQHREKFGRLLHCDAVVARQMRRDVAGMRGALEAIEAQLELIAREYEDQDNG